MKQWPLVNALWQTESEVSERVKQRGLLISTQNGLPVTTVVCETELRVFKQGSTTMTTIQFTGGQKIQYGNLISEYSAEMYLISYKTADFTMVLNIFDPEDLSLGSNESSDH